MSSSIASACPFSLRRVPQLISDCKKSRLSCKGTTWLQLPGKSGLLYHILPSMAEYVTDIYRSCQIHSDSAWACWPCWPSTSSTGQEKIWKNHMILHVFAIQPHCSAQLDARHRKRKLRPSQLNETLLLDSRPSKTSKLARFRGQPTVLNSDLFTVRKGSMMNAMNALNAMNAWFRVISTSEAVLVNLVKCKAKFRRMPGSVTQQGKGLSLFWLCSSSTWEYQHDIKTLSISKVFKYQISF